MTLGRPSNRRLGAGTLLLAALWLTASLAPWTAHRGRRPRDRRPAPMVLAPVAPTTAPAPSEPAGAARSKASHHRAFIAPRIPAGARHAAKRFLRAFAALLYGRGDPEALPDASAAVHQQASGAPDLAYPSRSPPHRLRGPWPDVSHVPAPGDVGLRAEIADPGQALEVDLELAPSPRARDGWTIVGLGW